MTILLALPLYNSQYDYLMLDIFAKQRKKGQFLLVPCFLSCLQLITGWWGDEDDHLVVGRSKSITFGSYTDSLRVIFLEKSNVRVGQRSLNIINYVRMVECFEILPWVHSMKHWRILETLPINSDNREIEDLIKFSKSSVVLRHNKTLIRTFYVSACQGIDLC